MVDQVVLDSSDTALAPINHEVVQTASQRDIELTPVASDDIQDAIDNDGAELTRYLSISAPGLTTRVDVTGENPPAQVDAPWWLTYLFYHRLWSGY